MLEVESSETCDSGLGEEPELHWREDRAAALARCAGVKHVLQRTARDSPDVRFLTLEARGPPRPCPVQSCTGRAALAASALRAALALSVRCSAPRVPSSDVRSSVLQAVGPTK